MHLLLSREGGAVGEGATDGEPVTSQTASTHRGEVRGENRGWGENQGGGFHRSFVLFGSASDASAAPPLSLSLLVHLK